jgi:hypothetical protein
MVAPPACSREFGAVIPGCLGVFAAVSVGPGSKMGLEFLEIMHVPPYNKVVAGKREIRSSGSRWSPVDLLRVTKLPERIATSVSQSSRSWIGSTLVMLATASFLIALSKPQNPAYRQVVEAVFHNWGAMAMAAFTLWLARRKGFGPLPMILRGASGVLLPISAILTFLGLLIWPPFWDVLRPFGVIESEARPDAITATMTVGLIGCVLLMLRAVFRWIRGFGRQYEHSGLALGFGPVYFFFRRRRISH